MQCSKSRNLFWLLFLLLPLCLFYFSKGIHQVQLKQQQSRDGKAYQVGNKAIEVKVVHYKNVISSVDIV